MKMIKRALLFGLIIATSTIPTFAGSVNGFWWTVPGASFTGETGVLNLTEDTNVGLDVKLNLNGDVKDKVTFWTSWWYSDTRKSNSVTVQEGGPSGRSMNVDNMYHASGDQIRINYKNANFGINTPYSINGNANYH